MKNQKQLFALYHEKTGKTIAALPPESRDDRVKAWWSPKIQENLK